MNDADVWRYLFAAAMVVTTLISGSRIFAELAWDRERSRLLDRIMARDYREFVAYTREPTKTQTLTEAERNALADADRLADAAHGIV